MRRLAAIAVIGWMCVTGTGARAQDAKALLAKTLKAYHDLNSYSGKLSTDVYVVAAKDRKMMGAISADLLYKRPNKLTLKVSSTASDIAVYSDGSKMVVYLEKYKKYSTGPSAPNLSALIPMMSERANIDSMLDPLYFLSSATLPPQLTNLKIQGNDSVNGHPVSVVTGAWTGDTPASATRNVFVRKGAHWKLYIDKSSFLLQKVEALIPGVLKQKIKQKDGKIVDAQLAISFVMRADVIDPKPNAPADDKSFVFTPPAGVTEQKSVKDLLNNGAVK